MTLVKGTGLIKDYGGGNGEFEDSLQTAVGAQVIFSALFRINRVYVDQIIQTTGYTGQGTISITFAVPPGDGAEIYLTT